MSLQVWLPLNGTIKNQGILNLTTTQQGTLSTVAGKIGPAYRFDTGAQTGNGISLNSNLVGSLGNNFSISVWINPYGNHAHYNGTIISSGNWNNTCWAFGLSQDNSYVDVFCNKYNIYLSCPVPLNTWTHLACVNNNGICDVYKNGVYIGSREGAIISASDASNTCIGRETYANGYFGFNGAIQDLRIYNHCLSPAEIRELSEALAVHYPLRDPAIESTTNLNSADMSSYTSYWNVSSQTPTVLTLTRNNSSNTVALTKSTIVSGLAVNDYLSISGYLYLNGKAIKTTVNTVTTYTSYYQVQSMESRDDGYFACTVKVIATGATWFIHASLFGACAEGDIGVIKYLQIEKKDHCTPFTVGTRNNQKVSDGSGFGYHGSTTGASSPSYIGKDSPRNIGYSQFSGVDKNITLSGSFLSAFTTGTVSFWCKVNTTGSSGVLPFTGQSTAYYLMASSNWTGAFYNGNVSGSITYYIDSIVDNTPPGADGLWHHYCATGVNLSSWTALKLNNYSSAWNGADISYSDIRFYNTAFTADQIKQLYNTSMQINSNSFLQAYEFLES